MKERGELGPEEREFAAVDQRGVTCDLQLTPGDKVRLFRKTSATIDGKRGDIGSNGDVVEIVRWTEGGVVLRDKRGRDGDVQWKRLADRKSNRLLLAYGHALTVDSAQGHHVRRAYQRAAAWDWREPRRSKPTWPKVATSPRFTP